MAGRIALTGVAQMRQKLLAAGGLRL